MRLYTPYFIARRLHQTPQKNFTRIVYQIGVISVALGLAATLIAYLIMQGFQRNIEHKLTSFNGHLQVVHCAKNRAHEEASLENHKLKELKQAYPSIIKAAKAFSYKTVLLKTQNDVEGIVCKGLDPGVTHDNLITYLTTGRFIDLTHQGYSHDIVLSTQTANRLRVQVGDEVIACAVQHPPRYRKLRVVGLYSTHIAELDEKLAFCDLRLVQRLNNWASNLVGSYEIFLYSSQQTQTMADRLSAWLDYGWEVKTAASEYAAIFDWLAIIEKNALIFMMLIVLVVGSNLISITLIQMMERTSMMGTLKTLGASNGQIQRVMLWSGLHMVMQGVFWGNLIGVGLCTLQWYGRFITLDPAYYYIDYIPIAWDWNVILGLNFLILVVVTTVILVSIAIISRIRPIQAIRFR